MRSKWKDTEKIIAAIEKRISEESQILHNVILPDLSGDSDGRQCDIIIKSGKYPRESLTIVEVQDRKSQLDITTFDGFVTKMKSVGAQHLIVVSKQEFPLSVNKRAQRLGPTVRLIKFNELMKDDFIINFLNDYITVLNHDLENFVVRIKKIEDESENLEKVMSILEEGRIEFVRDRYQYSPEELIFKCLKNMNISLSEGENKIRIEIPLNQRLMLFSEPCIGVAVEFDVVVITSASKLKLKYFEYKQQDIDNPLVWYAEGIGENNGKIARIGVSFIYDEVNTRYNFNLETKEGDFNDVVLDIRRIT
jgi:hypothetical protein